MSQKTFVTIEQDDVYFRVITKFETHKLHSEKLNLETAFKLAYEMRKVTEDTCKND